MASTHLSDSLQIAEFGHAHRDHVAVATGYRPRTKNATASMLISDGQCPMKNTGAGYSVSQTASSPRCYFERCTSVITVNEQDGFPIGRQPALIGEMSQSYNIPDEEAVSQIPQGHSDTEQWLRHKYLDFASRSVTIDGRITYPDRRNELAARQSLAHSRHSGSISGTVMVIHTVIAPTVVIPSDVPDPDVVSKFSVLSFSLKPASNEADMADWFQRATGLSHGHQRGLTSEHSLAVHSYVPDDSQTRWFALNHPSDLHPVRSIARLRFDPDASILHSPDDDWAKETMSQMYGGSEGLEVTCVSTVFADGHVTSTEREERLPSSSAFEIPGLPASDPLARSDPLPAEYTSFPPSMVRGNISPVPPWQGRQLTEPAHPRTHHMIGYLRAVPTSSNDVSDPLADMMAGTHIQHTGSHTGGASYQYPTRGDSSGQSSTSGIHYGLGAAPARATSTRQASSYKREPGSKAQRQRQPAPSTLLTNAQEVADPASTRRGEPSTERTLRPGETRNTNGEVIRSGWVRKPTGKKKK
ncbi:hypothetical protein IAT40_001092 [Kwoniella sp. CBS 6097]